MTGPHQPLDVPPRYQYTSYMEHGVWRGSGVGTQGASSLAAEEWSWDLSWMASELDGTEQETLGGQPGLGLKKETSGRQLGLWTDGHNTLGGQQGFRIKRQNKSG